MRHLLLLSTSKVHGQDYLAYCQEALINYWGPIKEILFIPYAAADHQAYLEWVQQHMQPMGFNVKGIHEFSDPLAALAEFQGLYVGGGNTFLLVKTLYEKGLIPAIRQRVMSGEMRYMGSSAGSNVACPTCKTTNDMPIVFPPSFETLNLVGFQINPHYLDPDPQSTHMGETREKRIQEFHEHNATPVLGLREGSWVEVHGEQAFLHGAHSTRLFQQAQEPLELDSGTDISYLL